MRQLGLGAAAAIAKCQQAGRWGGGGFDLSGREATHASSISVRVRYVGAVGGLLLLSICPAE